MPLWDAWADWASWWQRPYWSSDELTAYQSDKLRAIVRHAAENVPYYRKRFADAGLTPDDVTCLDDLASIPLSSKSDFTELAMEERLSAGTDSEKLLRHVTSGSTGVLLEVRRTRREELRVHSVQFRAQLLAGLRPSDRRVFLGDAWDRKPYHRAGLFRLNGLGANPDPNEALQRMRWLQPDVVVGHPSLVEMLLRSPHRSELASIRPRLVFTGAETLSPRARETYEATFRCPVIDFYGAHEVGHIAAQCRTCGRYHTCDDSVIVEVLRDGEHAGPGEEGEVVVTSLHSRAMPIIRYRLGDIVRLPAKKPQCRVGFGAIERIQGRALDYLDLPDGRRVNPYSVVEKLARIPGVVCFEVTQDDQHKIHVRCEARSGQETSCCRALRAACGELFPADQIASVAVVPRIPLTAAGKRRHIRTTRVI